MDERQRAKKILQALRQTYQLPLWTKQKPQPFQTLVTTIISQNTADRNTARAFEALSNTFEITPEALAKAEISQIENAIRVAGLYVGKARTIQVASKIIIEKYGGTLQPILALPLEQAREALMAIPGIGPKTADVVLLFSAGKPTIPVDTHVNRVAKRLGFAPASGDYECVRSCLQKLFDPADYLAVHLLLIELGRKTCKAQNPLHHTCVVCELCPSYRTVGSP